MHRKALLLILVAFTLLLHSTTPSRLDQPPRLVQSVAKRSSSAIAITPDGATLLAVNPDSNSVSLIDLGSLMTVTEVAVGSDPRTVAVDDAGIRAYVANRGSDSVSVLDLTVRQVITDVAVGNRPYGVLVTPNGERLYVAEQGLHRLAVLDTHTLATVDTIPTAAHPSGLALGDGGRTLYITHLLDKTITVLNLRPFTHFLPVVFQEWLAKQRSVAPLPGITSPSVTAPYSPSNRLPVHGSTDVLTATISLWSDSNLVQSIVLSPDGRRAYVPHTRSNTGNRALTFDTTVFPLVSLIDTSARQHMVGQQLDLATLDPPGVGLPFDAVATPDGEELWVLNAASNDISVVDLATRQLTAHIEVGDNPRGIVLSPDGAAAYVNNTLSGTVSVIDTAAYTVTGVITVTDVPLPPVLLNGKRLFHSSDDPRLSLAQWISCNTCHFEGEHDGRTWFFGFAGPRNTTSLLGMIETYPLRWSGEWDESADLEFANRKENFGAGLVQGEMNCSLSPPDCLAPTHPPNLGRSYDLDCLATFIDSLAIPLSPAHAHGEPLTEAELRGQVIFDDPVLGCATCHPAPLYTDQKLHDVGTATTDERIGPVFDTPSLRGLHNSAPYFHDGSAATLYDALTRPTPGSEHDVSSFLDPAEIQDLIAYLTALPFE